MVKEKKECYVIKIPLCNEPWIEQKLNKLFSNAHKVYNSTVTEILNRIEKIENTEEYSNARRKYGELKEEQKKCKDVVREKEIVLELKECGKLLQSYIKAEDLNGKYSLEKIVREVVKSNRSFCDISSPFIGSIAQDIDRAVKDYFYEDGKKIHRKSYMRNQTVTKLSGTRTRSEKTNSFQGVKLALLRNKLCVIQSYEGEDRKDKNNIYPLRVTSKDKYILNNLTYALDFDFVPETSKEYKYFIDALDRRISENKYMTKDGYGLLTFPKVGNCTLLREKIRGIWRYYLALNITGTPLNKFTDNHKQSNSNIVGIDMGPQTCSLCYRTKAGDVFRVEIFEFVPEIDGEYMGVLKELNYSLENKRRLNNKDNYNSDGTISKGLYSWKKSKNYKEELQKLQKLNRNKTIYTKISHNELVKHILSYAHNIVIEPFDVSALVKRAKETTTRTVIVEGKEVQRNNSKKRFGGSILKKSPALFLNTLKAGVKELCGMYTEVDRFTYRASQYNHQLDAYVKKSLNTRWNTLIYMGEEIQVQRDLYSAFLLCNALIDSEKPNKIDRDLCLYNFDSFIPLHDNCLSTLSELVVKSKALKNIFK